VLDFPQMLFLSFASTSTNSRLFASCRCDLPRAVLAYAVFPFFILLAGCYSMPTTPPTFFFISIRVLRAICYDPTNPRWSGMYLPRIIPHSLKLFLRCPLTWEADSRLLIHFTCLDILSRREISIF
jgi:hypothetical protein